VQYDKIIRHTLPISSRIIDQTKSATTDIFALDV